MAKKIKFALPLKDDAAVHTLDELREHFDLEKIIGYYQEGRLLTWLKDHYCEKEAEQVEALDKTSKNIKADLCRILGVEVEESALDSLDAESIGAKNERIARLKQHTADKKVIDNVDCVAFDQKELDKLLKNGISEIYLCNGKFTIPIKQKNKKYIGIDKVEIVIRSKKAVDFDELGIMFVNVKFDEKYAALTLPTTEELFEIANKAFEKEDYARAEEYALKAADAGSAEAMNMLGDLYNSGEGVPQDNEKAMEYYLKAAQTGNSRYMTLLGSMYRDGECFPKDATEAIKWYSKAIEYDYTPAMLNLGWMYAKGDGIEQDGEKAKKLFTQVASLGDSYGNFSLGELYQAGVGVNQDNKTAIKYYEKAAKDGNSKAAYKLAYIYHRVQKKNFQRARELYDMAAKDGVTKAMLFLGDMYVAGQGMEKNISCAIKYYEDAAEKNEAYAMDRLGDLYRYNDEVQDYSKALKWYQKAAEKGLPSALTSIGDMYYQGLGIPENKEQAVYWYHEAADAGDLTAMYNLGYAYEFGEGVEENHDEALKWMKKAADGGYESAIEFLNQGNQVARKEKSMQIFSSHVVAELLGVFVHGRLKNGQSLWNVNHTDYGARFIKFRELEEKDTESDDWWLKSTWMIDRIEEYNESIIGLAIESNFIDDWEYIVFTERAVYFQDTDGRQYREPYTGMVNVLNDPAWSIKFIHTDGDSWLMPSSGKWDKDLGLENLRLFFLVMAKVLGNECEYVFDDNEIEKLKMVKLKSLDGKCILDYL